MTQLPKLILASGSPRRSEILSAVGCEFEKDVPQIDEAVMNAESPDEYVVRLARSKAGADAVRAKAALFIEGVGGDYWMFVGLPVRSVYSLVSRFAEEQKSRFH